MAREATRTIPVVLVAVGGRRESGLAPSLVHPGANLAGVTGTNDFKAQGKRSEILTEALVIAEWSIQTAPIARKLVRYARYDGKSSSMPRTRSAMARSAIASANTSRVIAMAKTPSLKASS
jgi:hypothetical protein